MFRKFLFLWNLCVTWFWQDSMIIISSFGPCNAHVSVPSVEIDLILTFRWQFDYHSVVISLHKNIFCYSVELNFGQMKVIRKYVDAFEMDAHEVHSGRPHTNWGMLVGWASRLAESKIETRYHKLFDWFCLFVRLHILSLFYVRWSDRTSK